jgi:hypothetical protein
MGLIVTDKPNHPRFIDISGRTFNRLTVTGYWGRVNRRYFWNCVCICGTVMQKVDGGSIRGGNTKSCGCYRTERTKQAKSTHKETAGNNISPEYRAFAQAKNRCQNPNNRGYKHYGGRGIKFQFTDFDRFINEVGRRPSAKHSLERIDVNRHYEPGNVKWATPKEQSRNKRNNHRVRVGHTTLIIAEWAEINGLKRNAIYQRIFQYGWCEPCAVTLLKRGRCPHTTK